MSTIILNYNSDYLLLILFWYSSFSQYLKHVGKYGTALRPNVKTELHLFKLGSIGLYFSCMLCTLKACLSSQSSAVEVFVWKKIRVNNSVLDSPSDEFQGIKRFSKIKGEKNSIILIIMKKLKIKCWPSLSSYQWFYYPIMYLKMLICRM